MEASPSPPVERAEPLNLAIDAPDALEPRNMLHPPLSASSAASCSTAQAATLMPSANPPLSPAWEGKRDNEPQPVQARLALSPAGLDHARGLPSPIRPPTSAPRPTASPVPANAAGPQEFSAVHLRPDLMPPGAGSTQHQGAAAATAAVAAAASPGAPPSPAGPSEINDTDSPAPTRAGFFGSSSTTPTTPTMHTLVPRSPSPSSADMSGIFHLDLDSPLAGQATSTPREVVAAEDEDRVQDSPEEEKADDAAVPAGESSPSQAPAAATSNNVIATLSPGLSVPWGRVVPSPDSSDALQGSWGLLHEVLDEVPVLSPSSPTSQQRHPFLHRDRTSSTTPSAEERKGFARNMAATRSRLASASPSSGIVDRQEQQQLQQSYRSPSPSSPRMVTSPPTPAASAGNTPTPAARQHDTPASASAAPSPSPSASSSASRLPLPTAVSVSGQLPTVDEQLRSASSYGEGSGLNEPVVEEGKLQEEQQPPVPPPGGALGASALASFASAAEVAIPTGAGETASVGFAGEEDHKFGRPGGDEETGGLVAAVALRDECSVGGRGYVGKRFIQAAEALSESPQLRRAAGAAATAVSAAADTARGQFTYTSKTIGKILEASAKSFEEFVDEQLREDGSGQVLRREGGTGLLVPRSKMMSQAFIVAPGCCLCWEFRVKDHDLGFALRRRSQGMGGSTEEDVFELKRYPSGKTFQGRWTADGDTSAMLIMVFDNSYSCLRPKTLAYKAQVNRPGFDPTAPPPPPPPTPADTPTAQASQRRSSSPVFGSGDGGGGGASAGGVAGGGDTEAFAIDESEGEGGEPSSSSSSRPVPIYDVSDKEEGAGQEREQDKGDGGGVSVSHVEGDEPGKSESRWERAEPGFAGGGKRGGRGGVEEVEKGVAGGSDVSEASKIEDFLAMTETSGDGDGGGGGDGGGPSK